MADPEPTCCAEDCCPPLFGSLLGEPEAAELAAVLKALADPARLRILNCIAAAPGGEICACDLPAVLDRSQPTVSHHLSQLVNAGVLEREQRGKWAWFRIRATRLEELTAAMTPPVATSGN
ncbi:MAG: metalloregulator ArsR/SmtB family transcription factor [Acidimicrobiales bacterium]